MRTNEPVPAPIESTCTSGRLSMKRADVGRLLDVELAVGDQRDVEARAADVGADDVRSRSEPVGEVARADHAADRPGDQRARQLLGLDRDRAAVRGHDPQVEAGAGAPVHVAHRGSCSRDGSAAYASIRSS